MLGGGGSANQRELAVGLAERLLRQTANKVRRVIGFLAQRERTQIGALIGRPIAIEASERASNLIGPQSERGDTQLGGGGEEERRDAKVHINELRRAPQWPRTSRRLRPQRLRLPLRLLRLRLANKFARPFPWIRLARSARQHCIRARVSLAATISFAAATRERCIRLRRPHFRLSGCFLRILRESIPLLLIGRERQVEAPETCVPEFIIKLGACLLARPNMYGMACPNNNELTCAASLLIYDRRATKSSANRRKHNSSASEQ